MDAAFKTTRTQAMENVEGAIRMFAKDSGVSVSGVQITSNVAGLRGGEPSDTGVSVWFTWDNAMRCIAVDRYRKVEWNLQAIFHVIEAQRSLLRHGGLEMVRTSFRGFMALPAPAGQKQWHEILGVSARATAKEISAARQSLARLHHGDEAMMKAINVAHDEGMELGGWR